MYVVFTTVMCNVNTSNQSDIPISRGIYHTYHTVCLVVNNIACLVAYDIDFLLHSHGYVYMSWTQSHKSSPQVLFFCK